MVRRRGGSKFINLIAECLVLGLMLMWIYYLDFDCRICFMANLYNPFDNI